MSFTIWPRIRPRAKDVAAEHPEIVKQLQADTTSGGRGSGRAERPCRSIVGSDEENPVHWSAGDWANVYCDNIDGIRRMGKKYRPLAHDGQTGWCYEISLRRWPAEADTAINDPVPESKAVEARCRRDRALPIVSARLKIGDLFDETKPVAAGDKAVTFTVTLAKGRTQLRGVPGRRRPTCVRCLLHGNSGQVGPACRAGPDQT